MEIAEKKYHCNANPEPLRKMFNHSLFLKCIIFVTTTLNEIPLGLNQDVIWGLYDYHGPYS
jgi:hypothetical protein